MFKLKESILLFFLAFVSTIAYAQSLTVTGKVVDSEGYEVIGGSVIIKGAAGIGTVTDIDGHYSLKVNDASKDVLVFSYVGMTPQEVKVNNQSVINVTLQADAVLLVVGYCIGYCMRAWVLRQDSPSKRIIRPWWTVRSMIAAAMLGSPKILPHPLNSMLVV